MSQILWRQHRVILSAIAVCLLAAIGYLFMATRLYTSVARLEIRPAELHLLDAPDAAMSDDAITNYLNTQQFIITSLPVLEAVLRVPGIQQLRTLSRTSDPIAFLHERLRAELSKKGSILSVQLDSPYPKETALLVNGIVSAYLAHQSDARRAAATDMLKVLRGERADCDTRIAAITASMLNLRISAGTLSFESKDNAIAHALQKLVEAQTAARLEVIAADSAYKESLAAAGNDPELIRRADEMTGSRGILLSDAENLQLRSAIAAAEQRYAELQAQLQPAHPEVQKLQSQLIYLKTMYLSAAKQRWTLAKEREEQLQAAVQQQKKVAEGFSRDAAEYARLDSERIRLESQAEKLGTRIRELEGDAAAGAMNIRVLEPAEVAKKPSTPRPAWVLGLGLVGGLLSGIGLAYLREWGDPRFRSTREVRTALDLPVLGVIPRLTIGPSDLARRQTPSACPSEVVDACRIIDAAIGLREPPGQIKTLLIASPATGDGRSIVAKSLAIASAQAGKRVILIDADLRRPQRPPRIDANGQLGLSNVLLGETPGDIALQATAIPGLDILPCGSVHEEPSRILRNNRFREVLDELSARYDQLVIDSPAVNAYSDAAILAGACDATVLVIRIGSTDRGSAEHAYDRLLSVQARVLGVVVNDVPRHRAAERSRAIATDRQLPLAGQLPPIGGHTMRA